MVHPGKEASVLYKTVLYIPSGWWWDASRGSDPAGSWSRGSRRTGSSCGLWYAAPGGFHETYVKGSIPQNPNGMEFNQVRATISPQWRWSRHKSSSHPWDVWRRRPYWSGNRSSGDKTAAPRSSSADVSSVHSTMWSSENVIWQVLDVNKGEEKIAQDAK